MMKVETVTKKKKLKPLFLVSILLVVSLVILVTVFFKPRIIWFSLVSLRERISCNMRGGIWKEPSSNLDLRNPYVVLGCVKEFTDGGKDCESGKECLSGVCSSMFGKKLRSNGHYFGNCHEYLLIDENSSNYKPNCQEMIIEGGRIVNSNDCMY